MNLANLEGTMIISATDSSNLIKSKWETSKLMESPGTCAAGNIG